MNLKLHVKIAFGYFLIIAVLGVLMRMVPLTDIPFTYKYIVHTHSHIALLGWVYTAITSLIYYVFLANNHMDKKYNKLFWATLITIIGMLLSFPFMGYALFSIIFSTLFLGVSYYFTWLFLRYTKPEQKQKQSYKLIRASLWFMVFSSLGPWALGIIMNTLGNTSAWYKNAIYFYLHFQYNGWFIVALLGLFFSMLEKLMITFTNKEFKQFYWLFIMGVLLTYFLSILWMEPHTIFYGLAGIGTILQIIAFDRLVKKVTTHKSELRNRFKKIELRMITIVILLFACKLLFQLVASFPNMSLIISNNIDLIIGYIHWVFLGIVSISLFALLHHFKLISITKNTFTIYLLAFILTEMLLFYKGTMVWLQGGIFNQYYVAVCLASSLFLIAIGIIFIRIKFLTKN